MNAVVAGANLLWLGSNLPAFLSFRAALRDPDAAQRRLWREYIRAHGDTAFGRAHGIDSIRSYGEFARRVPLMSYDDLEPWIERVRNGEANVLTRERVAHLIPTSGSTAARKLIPFTAGLQREFNRALGPWLADLYRSHPSLAPGAAYWAITPVAQSASENAASVPVGFDDDAAYLGGTRERLARAVMAVPSAVRFVKDMDTFRYVTLLCLLKRRDLALISVWHPSFLRLLLDALPEHWDSLLADIEEGTCAAPLPDEVKQQLNLSPSPARAAELREAGWRPPDSYSAWWPGLRVISCWGDGPADLALNDLRSRFPNVFIQPKGLLATEAFVTIPFAGAWPLAIRSHFFEFIDEQGRVHPAGDLKRDAEYEVVVTTAGGLWRYRLGDLVRVSGFLGRTPSLKFLGRTGGISDRFGEKLSEAFVGETIRELMDAHGASAPFAMLAPDAPGSPCYTLYVETNAAIDAGELDGLLRRNPNYDYCRQLGQLGPARLFRVARHGYETFAAHETANGKCLGEIKPCVLSRFDGWSERFEGCYLRDAAPELVQSAGA